MIILALMPVMLLAERVHPVLPMLLMVVLWLTAQFSLVHFPAEPWTERPWFFNPLGWQLIFFLGFFLMRGTLAAAAQSLADDACHCRRGDLHSLCLASNSRRFAILPRGGACLASVDEQVRVRPAQAQHFLALAYIAVHAVGVAGRRLIHPGIYPVTRVLMKVGQQSLAVFMTGMVVAQIIGIWLDHAGRTPLPTTIGNLVGFAALIATAYLVGWLKASAPWKPELRIPEG